ncbi:MAG TPA: apolipoprotein N-acyltransferase [Alphaproteobacteria bacterium]|nr:apolipoprotein N-acyltransferase [Alphaproteobacteria bacterium]
MLGFIAALGQAPSKWSFAFIGAFAVFIHTLKEKATSSTQAFWFGFSFAFGYFFYGLSWIASSFEVVGLSHLKILPMVAIPFILALFWGAASFATVKVRGPFFLKVIIFFSLSEYLRGHAFTGFPWNLPCYIWDSDLLQALQVVGPYGLTLLTFALACTKKELVVVNYAVVELLSYFAAGFILTPQPHTQIPIRLIQPCIEQNIKWQPGKIYDILSTYINLSFSKKEGFTPKVIFWPEAALPLLLNENPELIEFLTSLIPAETYLITGSLRRDEKQALFNSLYVIEGQRGVVSFYDKVHLVPFGEYLPFRTYLPSFIQKLTPGSKDYSSGSASQTIKVGDLFSFTPLICYEAIFPHVLGPTRPDVLLTLTNDAWFGKTFGPNQHLEHAKARAIEEGLPMIRVANNGISAVMDARGEFVKSLNLDQCGVLDTYIPVAKKPTLYATYGDTIFLLLLGILLALSALGFKRFWVRIKV